MAALRKYEVCINPDIEDIEVEAEAYYFDDQVRVLKFLVDRKPVAVFNTGWVYFREVR